MSGNGNWHLHRHWRRARGNPRGAARVEPWHENGSRAPQQQQPLQRGCRWCTSSITMARPAATPAPATEGAQRRVVSPLQLIEGWLALIDLVDAQNEPRRCRSTRSTSRSCTGNVLELEGLSGSMVQLRRRRGVCSRITASGPLVRSSPHTRWWSIQRAGRLLHASVLELSTNEERSGHATTSFATTEPTDLRPLVILGPRDAVTQGIADMAGDWASNGVTPYR